MLPKLDGFGVLEALRQKGMMVPVLMLSALDSVDDRVRGLRAGADDYLVKPFRVRRTHRPIAGDFVPVRRGEKRSRRTDAPFRWPTSPSDRLDPPRPPWVNVPIDLQPKEFALLEYLSL